VHVTIAGSTYRSSVASMRGVFMLPVSADVRENAGIAAGDELDVTLELDTVPRVVTVPPDFAVALEQDAQARRFFGGLSSSNKLRYVLAIEGARSEETRQRRIARSVDALREGRT
jgi:hypothetical protein